jgi:DNA-binding NtrC family response regulator
LFVDELKHILVIDKEKLLIDLLSRVMPADAVQVLSAESCDQAKAVLVTEPIEVLLINPETEGAVRMIADIKKSKMNTCVMALTGSFDQETLATAAGVEVLRKNRTLAELLRSLEMKLNIPLITPGARRILVVDDDPGVSAFLRDCLVDQGYFVHFATNGVEALETLRTEPGICVVLLDIMMPLKGGIDTLYEIEKMKVHPAVIIMTGVCDSAIAELAIKAGAADFITKPLDAVNIISAVDAAVAHLDMRRNRRNR